MPEVIYVLRWQSEPGKNSVDSVFLEQSESIAKKGALEQEEAMEELVAMFADQMRMYLGVLIGIRPEEISWKELEEAASAGTEAVSIDVAMNRDRTATLGDSLSTALWPGKLISRKLARSSVASGLAKVLMAYRRGDLSITVV